MSFRSIIRVVVLLYGASISAIPTQGQYSNATRVEPTLASTLTSSTTAAPSTNDSCSADCFYLPLSRYSTYWSKYIKVETIATVLVVINDSDNTTSTTTNFVQSFLINGTAPTNSLPPRTDTNSDGTVTQTIRGISGTDTVFTYPTPYYEIAETYSFSGIIPYTNDDTTTTCVSSPWTFLSLPSHTPFPSPTGNVDPGDQYGLLYTMQDDYRLQPLSQDFIATEFPGALVDNIFQSCKIPLAVAPATMVAAVSFLTASSTIHISKPAAQASQLPVPQPAQIAPSRNPPPPSNPPKNPGPPAAVKTLQPEVVPHAPSGLRQADHPGANPAGSPPAQPAPNELPDNSSNGPPDSSPNSPPDSSSNNPPDSPPNAPPSQENPQQPASPVPGAPSPAPQPLRGSPQAIGSYIMSGLGGIAPASVFTIGTQTLLPGGPGITVSGTPVSLFPSGTQLVVGSGTGAQTVTGDIPGFISGSLGGGIATITPAPTGAASIAPDSSGNSPTAYVFGTQTLVPGGPAITVSGTVISVAENGETVVVGTGTGAITQTGDTVGEVISSAGGRAVSSEATRTTGAELKSPSEGVSKTATADIALATTNVGMKTGDAGLDRLLISLVGITWLFSLLASGG